MYATHASIASAVCSLALRSLLPPHVLLRSGFDSIDAGPQRVGCMQLVVHFLFSQIYWCETLHIHAWSKAEQSNRRTELSVAETSISEQ